MAIKVFIIDGKAHTVKEMADIRGCKAQNLYSYMDTIARKNPDLTNDEVAALAIKYKPIKSNTKHPCPDGKERTANEIAEWLGISREAITARMRRYGVNSPLVFASIEEIRLLGREQRDNTMSKIPVQRGDWEGLGRSNMRREDAAARAIKVGSLESKYL